MVHYIFYFICCAIFTEAVTELFTKSLIFSGLREKIVNRGGFVAALISCGYCTSVWVSLIPSLFFVSVMHDLNYAKFLGMWLFVAVVVHRSSNYLHNFNDKWLDKFYSKKELEVSNV